MGNHQMRSLRPEVMEVMRKKTGFSVAELADLYRQYRLDTENKPSLTEGSFQKIYRQAFPHVVPDELAHRVFQSLHSDGRNRVDFHSFAVHASILLKASEQSRYQWAVNVVKQSPGGALSQTDVTSVMRMLHQLFAGVTPGDGTDDPDHLASDVWLALTQFSKNNSSIESHEFVNAAMANSCVKEFVDGLIKAAVMPFEIKKTQTGSYGRPRGMSARRRRTTVTSATVDEGQRGRSNTVV